MNKVICDICGVESNVCDLAEIDEDNDETEEKVTVCPKCTSSYLTVILEDE